METDDQDIAFNDANPLIMPDSVNEQQLERLMRKIDFKSEREYGWDHPYAGLTLYVVYDNAVPGTADAFTDEFSDHPELGKPLRMGTYNAQKLMPVAWLMRHAPKDNEDGGPLSLLERFVLNLTYAPPIDRGPDQTDVSFYRSRLRQPGVIGFAAVYEAWDRSHTNTAMSDLMRADRVSFSEMPGSRSVRTVIVVDFLSGTHALKHFQGDTMPIDILHGGWLAGHCTTTLRTLVDMVYSRSPRPSVWREHYTSLNAMLAKFTAEGDQIAEVSRIVNGADPDTTPVVPGPPGGSHKRR